MTEQGSYINTTYKEQTLWKYSLIQFSWGLVPDSGLEVCTSSFTSDNWGN